MMQRLVDLSGSRHVPPTSIGLIHAGLGERDAALIALERGFALRDVRMTLMRDDRASRRRCGR